MNALLIDAGNSRIKWATVGDGKLRAAQGLDWSPRTLPRVARRIAAAASAAAVEAVLVSSVAGATVASALRRAMRAAGAPAPRFVHSPRRAAGVSNGYRVPQRLGVDRWLCLVAARDQYPVSPVCVIGIGTAMTVDLLDGHGRHRGGAIAPGPQLMVSALLAHTALIRARAAQGSMPTRQRLFATDTRAAIAGGSLHACAALIPHALLEGRRLLGVRPRLLLTGGAANAVRRAAGLRVRVADDLVLRGLAVLARRRTR